MKFGLLILLFFCSLCLSAQRLDVKDYGAIPNSLSDAVPGVKKAIAACPQQDGCVISFPEGRYDFWPEQAEEHIYFISNSSSAEEYPEKKQRAGLYFKGLKNMVIEGNNSLFVFHGKMISWIFDHCEKMRLQNIRIDYERPGMSEMTIMEATPGSITVKVHPDSKFRVNNGTVVWYGENWITQNFHAVLADTVTGVNREVEWEAFEQSKAEILYPQILRFTGVFFGFKASPGQILTVRDRYRDYVGALINRSKNVSLQNVHMQFMHGLGIISQFSENLYFDSVFIEPAKGNGRAMASSADGMHFSGCKGQILIDHCRFRGLHDDAVNVHGTHLKITKLISPRSVTLRFMHDQTYGFEAFIDGDSVAFVHPASLRIFETGVVKTARLISEKEILVEFTGSVPAGLKVGDVLENTSWTPSLTLRNSCIEGTNTRGLLVTTKRKVLVENNIFFRTGMHAILIANDALSWFESGPVTDVMIRNNVFEDCAYNNFPHNYPIMISPQNKKLIKGYQVHKNIRIINNVFRVYDYPLLSAASVNGLTFSENTIVQTHFMPPGKKRPVFQLKGNTDVRISKNHF